MRVLLESDHTKIKITEIIESLKNTSATVLIYCAGKLTVELLEHYPEILDLNLKAIVDKNRDRHGERIKGILIIDPSEIINIKPDYIIVSTYYTEPIVNYLEKLAEENELNFEIITDIFVPRPERKYKVPEGKDVIRVEVGTGQRPKRGFIHCDIQKLSGVDHVCKAWEIPFDDVSIDEIYSRHMLEHLTLQEAKQTLQCWFNKLKDGGILELVVPDLNFHVRQFLEMEYSWSKDRAENLNHAMAGFYGWQNNEHDIHKWGYTRKAIVDLLSEVGFSGFNFIHDDRWHIHLECFKPVSKNSSNWEMWLEENMCERMDPNTKYFERNNALYHLYRYQFAEANFVKDKNVLDIACGVGYGSRILSTSAAHVTGVDISDKAIQYAKNFYNAENIQYKVGSVENIPFDNNSIDVVVSFETIEHIVDDLKYIDEIKRVLKDNGLYIVSTPNGFIDNGFHYRGYNYKQFKEFLSKKFDILYFYNYNGRDTIPVIPSLTLTTEENYHQAETFYVVCKKI
jgi:predicted SAM-dependent methyltransferase